MEYKPQQQSQPKVVPRLIIHGGAGNIKQSTLPPEKRKAYREALFRIVKPIRLIPTSLSVSPP